jgi:hypothetical protein
MGQARNSRRNASLDARKARAAGRQQSPDYPEGDLPIGALREGKSAVAGAFGKDGHVRRGTKGTALTKDGGGGGAAFSAPKGTR